MDAETIAVGVADVENALVLIERRLSELIAVQALALLYSQSVDREDAEELQRLIRMSRPCIG